MRAMVLFTVSEEDFDNIHGWSQRVPMPRSSTVDADAVRFGRIVRGLRNQRGWTIGDIAAVMSDLATARNSPV